MNGKRNTVVFSAVLATVLVLGLLTQASGFKIELSTGNDFITVTVVNGAGLFATRGENGTENVSLTSLDGNGDRGFMAVYDENESLRAGVFVDGNGRGVVRADVIEQLSRFQGRSGLEIVYSGLSGPESAVYYRGLTELVNGRAVVQLPEHFTAVAAPETATVQLTPHAMTSLGLAVASLENGVLEIGELNGGRGSYRVSFTVFAARDELRGRSVIFRDSAADDGAGARGADDYPLLDRPSGAGADAANR